MLTRLQVSGFKNLVDVDLRFGPFTCIAGPNAVGKSNLFDAIAFLRALMQQPLLEAASSVRADPETAGDPRAIFRRVKDDFVPEILFRAEMLVPRSGVDDLGQNASANSTFLNYTLRLGWRHQPDNSPDGLELREESLHYVTVGHATTDLAFPHSPDWRRSVVFNSRRGGGYLSTETGSDGGAKIRLHQDGVAGRPRDYVASTLPRTVLSSVNALESPTALLARREIESWRQLQLEPAALRRSDSYRDPRTLAVSGAHLPGTLARLATRRGGPGGSPPQFDDGVLARVANRLAELIDGVHSLRVEDDERRELLTVVLRETNGTEHAARSLSDGTLRFLALAVMEEDPDVRGTICLEEPENGIQPGRIPAMLRLLQDLAVDPQESIGDDNPLRQVIINTHSPAVVANVPDHSVIAAVPATAGTAEHRASRINFEALPGTWRVRHGSEVMPPGRLLEYLRIPDDDRESSQPDGGRRVKDREDLNFQTRFDFDSVLLAK